MSPTLTAEQRARLRQIAGVIGDNPNATAWLLAHALGRTLDALDAEEAAHQADTTAALAAEWQLLERLGEARRRAFAMRRRVAELRRAGRRAPEGLTAERRACLRRQIAWWRSLDAERLALMIEDPLDALEAAEARAPAAEHETARILEAHYQQSMREWRREREVGQ